MVLASYLECLTADIRNKLSFNSKMKQTFLFPAFDSLKIDLILDLVVSARHYLPCYTRYNLSSCKFYSYVIPLTSGELFLIYSKCKKGSEVIGSDTWKRWKNVRWFLRNQQCFSVRNIREISYTTSLFLLPFKCQTADLGLVMRHTTDILESKELSLACQLELTRRTSVCWQDYRVPCVLMTMAVKHRTDMLQN